MTTREDAYPYPSEQYILSVDRYQIEVMDHLDELPATVLSSSALSPRCVMASDTPHASLRSAPRHKFPCSHAFVLLNTAIRRTQHAPAAYNPPGAPHAGAFL